MITRRQAIHGIRGLMACACLLVAGVVVADVAAVDGPCRLKLRSGRIMEARGLEPVDATGAFWRIALDGGNAVVVPLREIKRVEALPAIAHARRPEDQGQGGGVEPGDVRSCDPVTDRRLLRWDSLITESSTRHGIDGDLVRAIMAVESCGNADAVSRKGAIGLMQLLPTTARDYGCANPRDPKANVEAGCRHLARLQAKLGSGLDLVLAAYNAGEGAVARSKGVPKYRETQAYVRDVLAHHARLTDRDPS